MRTTVCVVLFEGQLVQNSADAGAQFSFVTFCAIRQDKKVKE